MKSPGVLLCLALLFVANATPASADEASKRLKIEELFNVMHMDQMIPQITQQVMAQMQQMMAEQSQKMSLPPDSAPRLEAVQKNECIGERQDELAEDKAIYVKVYADTFTEEEVGGISNFYKTPAGQAFLKKMPLLTQNTMQATQGMMGDLMAEIPRMLEEINKQYK